MKPVRTIINTIMLAGIIGFGRIVRLAFWKKVAIYANAYRASILKQEFRSAGENFAIQSPYHVVGMHHISIGDNFSAFAGLRLDAVTRYRDAEYAPDIRIGNNVSINFDCHIGCIEKITIGNNVLLASKVFITDHFHGAISRASLEMPPLERPLVSKGPVTIGDCVWIGEGAVIMPGVTIGHNAVVGANAVVVHDVPPFAVVGGIPAKVIKQF